VEGTVAVDEHLIESPPIEVKRLVSSMEIEAGNREGLFISVR